MRGDKYENTFNKACNVIDGIIENDNSVAVISQLVILEMVNIFRTKVIQREPYKGKLKDNINRIEDLKHTIQSFTKEFIDKITKWEYTGKLNIISISKQDLHQLSMILRYTANMSTTFSKT